MLTLTGKKPNRRICSALIYSHFDSNMFGNGFTRGRKMVEQIEPEELKNKIDSDNKFELIQWRPPNRKV